jgi:hypothetical protein
MRISVHVARVELVRLRDGWVAHTGEVVSFDPIPAIDETRPTGWRLSRTEGRSIDLVAPLGSRLNGYPVPFRLVPDSPMIPRPSRRLVVYFDADGLDATSCLCCARAKDRGFRLAGPEAVHKTVHNRGPVCQVPAVPDWLAGVDLSAIGDDPEPFQPAAPGFVRRGRAFYPVDQLPAMRRFSATSPIAPSIPPPPSNHQEMPAPGMLF